MKFYPPLSTLIFLFQFFFIPFWILKLSDWSMFKDLSWEPVIQIAGMIVVAFFSGLYFWALKSLGDNYSPCYDLHLPKSYIVTGPYAFLNHPMYLSKIGGLIGQFLMTGCAWILIPTVYIGAVCLISIRREEEISRIFHEAKNPLPS
ncbi:MAG: hypothetical protein NT027_12770 [Proteobacteria bacterium]|nr:hypothetical protein [Pseudomonadota bacterium]